jgi:hypothetical protein
MSLPTSEPLPSKDDNLSPARRRQRRRSILQAGPASHTELLDALARGVIPSIDFFLFSLLSGCIIGAAILFDARALFVLAALAAPFMAPAVGLSLATVIGSWTFFLQSLASFSIGSLLVFIAGMGAGWIAGSFPGLTFEQAAAYTRFSWADFTLLTLGAVFTAVLLVRKPEQKPVVPSIALAYGLYLPIGSSRFWDEQRRGRVMARRSNDIRGSSGLGSPGRHDHPAGHRTATVQCIWVCAQHLTGNGGDRGTHCDQRIRYCVPAP